MYAILGAILFVLLVVIVHKKLKRRELLNTVPGPKGIPLIGNIFNVRLHYKDLIKTSLQLQEQYGDVVKVEMGPIIIYFVKDKDLINKVYSEKRHMGKPKHYTKFLASWIDNSVAGSDGPYWKSLRKLHMTSFGHKNLEYFLESFNYHSKIFNNILEDNIAKDSFDIDEMTQKCTLDIACSTILNYNANTQENNKSEMHFASKVLFEAIMSRLFNILYQFDWLYKFSNLYEKEKRSAKIFKDLVDTIIEERKTYLLSENFQLDSAKGYPVIDNLIIASKHDESITNKVIHDEVTTFLVAGVDTIAIVVKFTLYVLSKHQDIQNKIGEELKNVFGDSTRDVTMDDFNSMQYLGMVIKESLRKYPIGPFIARILSEDLQYENYTLVKDSLFFVCLQNLQNDARYFDNPEEFDPERFSAENLKNIDPLTYIPFSYGPRICLGMQFAVIATRVILATVLRQFKILPAIPKFTPNVIAKGMLTSTNGIRIRIIKR